MSEFRMYLLLGCVGLAACSAAADPVDVEAEMEQFLLECGKRGDAALAADKMAVEGKDNWIFLSKELSHLGKGRFWGPESAKKSTATRDDAKDPLPVILDTHRQLKELGIDLILVPVPPRAIVYADKVSDKAVVDENGLPVRADPHHREFYGLLRKEGMNVLDLTDAFITAREYDDKFGPVCCMHDTHWSSRGCEIAAREIRKAVKSRGWLDGRALTKYTVLHETLTITGDLWRFLGKEAMPRESTVLWKVSKDGKPVEPDEKSPVLLLADSHGLVFHIGDDMHATGAGFADHLVSMFGFPIDEISRRGSAATSIRIDLARKFYRDDAYREGKKLIVWCFAAREFTETMGWRKLRLTRKK